MRTLVIGDIHGGMKALEQVLERANFTPDDTIISLGDIVDGWPESAEVVEFMSNLDKLVYILGNHDQWAHDWFKYSVVPPIWRNQGGQATINSYIANVDKNWGDKHSAFFDNALPYYVENNRLYVHGGFSWKYPIEQQDPYYLTWDRDLFAVAHMWEEQGKGDRVKDYDEVFIGHTTTSRSDPSLKPVHVSNVWCLDQGAGWEGKLTCMDVDTKEYWQSDIVKDLYPGHKHRT